jgi:hypothetical protein
VDGRRACNYFCAARAQTLPVAQAWCSLRARFRLRAIPPGLEFTLALAPHSLRRTQAVANIRIHETIHGRPYVIEVVSISRDRWRAQIARRGATTALMPFYGPTPDDAARQLACWLTRAGQSQVKT